MLAFLSRMTIWWQDCRAATGLEYALLAGGIGLACISALFLMGNSIDGIFNALGGEMTNNMGVSTNG
jgi:Flp pilus assembly pilin Flp